MTVKLLVRSSLRILSAAGAIGLAASMSAPAFAIFGTFSTSGVYDEQITNEQGPGNGSSNFMNAVDAEAVGNNVTLAQFKIDVQNAFNTNKGGVCSFDNDTNATNNADKQFVALLGSNQATQFTVTRDPTPLNSTNFGLNNNFNNPTISGFNYLGISGDATPVLLNFNLPLETFAITALSRGGDRTMILTINYDNGTNHVFAEEALGALDDDTFFAWKAPVGRTITGVQFDNNSGYVRYDDMGMILANFQPGDADGDLDVDINDYNLIKNNFGLTPATKAQGDVTLDGIINLADFQLWKANEALAATGSVGAVPEPASVVLALLGVAAVRSIRVGRQRSK